MVSSLSNRFKVWLVGDRSIATAGHGFQGTSDNFSQAQIQIPDVDCQSTIYAQR
jgi:hypothetical protein